MFGYALRHPKLPAKNGIVNVAGLTPLTLACKLGRAEVFREMLELSSREFWRYSNITCSGYPLNALDTLLPDGRTSKTDEWCFAFNYLIFLLFRLEFSPVYHFKWYKRRAFGYVRWWHYSTFVRRKVENIRQSM